MELGLRARGPLFCPGEEEAVSPGTGWPLGPNGGAWRGLRALWAGGWGSSCKGRAVLPHPGPLPGTHPFFPPSLPFSSFLLSLPFPSPEDGSSWLPLYGSVCCRLAAQPHCMVQQVMCGFLRVQVSALQGGWDEAGGPFHRLASECYGACPAPATDFGPAPCWGGGVSFSVGCAAPAPTAEMERRARNLPSPPPTTFPWDSRGEGTSTGAAAGTPPFAGPGELGGTQSGRAGSPPLGLGVAARGTVAA